MVGDLKFQTSSSDQMINTVARNKDQNDDPVEDMWEMGWDPLMHVTSKLF